MLLSSFSIFIWSHPEIEMQISGKAVTVFCCVAAAIQIAYSYFEQQNRSPKTICRNNRNNEQFSLHYQPISCEVVISFFKHPCRRKVLPSSLPQIPELSHCGILFQTGKSYSVPAGAIVWQTSLETWVKRGRDGRYIVKRVCRIIGWKSKALIKELMNLNIRFLGKSMMLNSVGLTMKCIVPNWFGKCTIL